MTRPLSLRRGLGAIAWLVTTLALAAAALWGIAYTALRVLGRWGILLALVGLSCSSRGGDTAMTDPMPPASSTTMVLTLDAGRHHLGAPSGISGEGPPCRPDFVVKCAEGLERSYTFVLGSRPAAARVEVRVFDMDLLGAEVRVNGVLVLVMPPPTHNGTASAEIAPAVLSVGANTLTIRAGRSATQVEDFEYDQLVLTLEL